MLVILRGWTSTLISGPSHLIVILPQDKAQPETQARSFGSLAFEAYLAVDDPAALALVRQPGSDGFRMASSALFQVGRSSLLHSPLHETNDKMLDCHYASLRNQRSFRKTSKSTKEIRKQKGSKTPGGLSEPLMNRSILFMGLLCPHGQTDSVLNERGKDIGESTLGQSKT